MFFFYFVQRSFCTLLCRRAIHPNDPEYVPFRRYVSLNCYSILFPSHSSIGHGAANVTLGIPRLREIVMTASQNPKTSSMTMLVRSGVSLSDVDAFFKRASRLVLSQIVDIVTVKERLTVNGDARHTEFFIDIAFFPREEYEAEYDVEPSEILTVFATEFPLILKKEIQVDMKKLDIDLRNQITELRKAKLSKVELVDDRELRERGKGKLGKIGTMMATRVKQETGMQMTRSAQDRRKSRRHMSLMKSKTMLSP